LSRRTPVSDIASSAIEGGSAPRPLAAAKQRHRAYRYQSAAKDA
jgi:hypothetical protein